MFTHIRSFSVTVRAYNLTLFNLSQERLDSVPTNHLCYITILLANVIEVHDIWWILLSTVGAWNAFSFVYDLLSAKAALSSEFRSLLQFFRVLLSLANLTVRIRIRSSSLMPIDIELRQVFTFLADFANPHFDIILFSVFYVKRTLVYISRVL